MAGTGATASQAWAVLKRHARDEIKPLRLQELCRDNDRVSALVTVYNPTPNRMLVADLSRQRMTLETLNHLLRLASARGVRKYITRLAWGQNDPENPVVPRALQQKENDRTRKNRRLKNNAAPKEPSEEAEESIKSYHLSLRAPKTAAMLTPSGDNALTSIHNEWDRIKRMSESIRIGQLSGVTGSIMRDIVVVGRGVPIMALRFIYLALCKDETATMGRRAGLRDRGIRTIKFLTSVDPVRIAGVVGAMDPASTLVISIALSGNEETTITTNTLRTWILEALGHGRKSEVVLGKHMILVTGNTDNLKKGQRQESIFLIPQNCRSEPFTTFTAATLLPLSIVFGWPVVQQLVKGAHSMDKHFVETNPRHNLPILLALTDIWNQLLLSSNERMVSPFSEAFAAYPAFCATLEAQTCGNFSNKTNRSSMVIDGGLHHAYDKALYQADQVISSELIMTMDSQTSYNAASSNAKNGMADVHAAQDMLICSMFAHADELAFGTDSKANDSLLGNSRTEPFDTDEVSDGNRPSTLLMCDKCDAFVCGQLVALAEHRVVIKARLWNNDPFAKEIGSSIRVKRTNLLKESLENMFAKLANGEDLDDNEEFIDGEPANLSTRTILRHYANMMKGQRRYDQTEL